MFILLFILAASEQQNQTKSQSRKIKLFLPILQNLIGILMIYSIFLYDYSFTHEGSSGNWKMFLDDHIAAVVMIIGQ